MTWTAVRSRLAEALEANRPGSGTPHVMVALPSYNIPDSLLQHYADRIGPLEHRYLTAMPLLARLPDCELVLVCSTAPEAEVVDYYVSLLPEDARARVRDRFHVLAVDDATPRGVSAKLLERPDLLDRLRSIVAGRPAVIEPWNVTEAELAVAEHVGAALDGTPPSLEHLGHKSAGRRLLRDAGVPVADGVEDVRTVDDVLAAVRAVRARRPRCRGVVVKTDDSSAGDGNRVIRFAPGDDVPDALAGLPDWYRADLLAGGVVEELVHGEPFSSPSVQLDLLPDGTARVVATHEQVLGGQDDQVYLGCRFPADERYAAELAEHGRAAGGLLAARGALGRVGLDFAVGTDPRGGPWTCALEINLRKGGTTHPYAALRNLVPGHYDDRAARWVADADASHRFYEATDNLLDPDWLGRPPAEVIAAVRSAGLEFRHDRGTGVVLHMLSCLAVDGRMGLTAIGTSRTHAADLHTAAVDALRA